MIEINLLPGSSAKSHGSSGLAVGAMFRKVGKQVRDPFLLTATASVIAAVFVVGTLYLRQDAMADQLSLKEQHQVQDSTRYAAVLREKKKAEAQRDSVMRQLDIIKTIDNNRFVWPHIMDEISRSLPQFTWLVSIQQTAAPDVPTTTNDAKDKDKKKHDDEDDLPQQVKFQIVGHTVDIQALTRFMQLLEASPFVQNVQLRKSDLIAVGSTQVTEFTLDAEYQQPDSSAIRTVPLTLSVR